MDQFSDNHMTDNRDLFTDSQTISRKKETEVSSEETTETYYQEVTLIETQSQIMTDQYGSDPELQIPEMTEILTELLPVATDQFPEVMKTVNLEPETDQIREVPKDQETERIPEQEPQVIIQTQIVQDQKSEKETVNPELIQAVQEIRENLIQLKDGVLSGDDTTTELEPEGTTETDISLAMLEDSISENFLEIQSVVEIIAKDQQLIGKVTIGANLVLIGIFVIYMFFGRIR